MSKKRYNGPLIIHHTLLPAFGGDQKLASVTEAMKELTYLDHNTGLHNRVLTRDPITGLGDLPPELNMLRGSNIKRKFFEYRDPICLQGNLGGEYNCLDGIRPIISKKRIERNPITLIGNLGDDIEEIYLRRAKLTYLNKSSERNPISGVGEFGREWDPIYKYDGHGGRKRCSIEKTDPITHVFALEDKMNANEMRHFTCNDKRDVIGHTTIGNDDVNYLKAHGTKKFSKHFPKTDIISHREFSLENELSQNKVEISAPAYEGVIKLQTSCKQEGLKGQIVGRNPITHRNYLYFGNNNEEMRKNYAKRITSSDITSSLQCDTPFEQIVPRSSRNPISGVGMQNTDYFDSIKLPPNYTFRTFLYPHLQGKEVKQNKKLANEKPKSLKGKMKKLAVEAKDSK